jgi:hypothetical protein
LDAQRVDLWFKGSGQRNPLCWFKGPEQSKPLGWLSGALQSEAPCAIVMHVWNLFFGQSSPLNVIEARHLNCPWDCIVVKMGRLVWSTLPCVQVRGGVWLQVKTSKTFLRDVTVVSPTALLLFGGALTVEHDGGYVSVDGWIRIRCTRDCRIEQDGIA